MPDEIKSIDLSHCTNDKNNTQTNNISISLAPIYNRVSVKLINDNYGTNNMPEIIKSKLLFKVLKIEGIYTVERYYSKSGRLCILFNFNDSILFYYYGFYYTEDNKPIGWQGEDVSFNKYKNIWIWKDHEDFSRTYITERIAVNWFYFQMTD